MENRNNTRKIVEAGLFAALTIVIAFFVFFVPFVGMVGLAVLPIPFAILYIKYDFKLAMTSLVASIILVALTMGIQRGLSIGSMYGPTGLVLGYCFKNKIKMSRTIFLLAIVFIIGVALNISFYLLFIDRNFIANTINTSIEIIRESLERSMRITGTTVDSPQNEQLKQMIESITPEMFLYIIPGSFVLYGFLVGFVNFTVTRSILQKLRYEVMEVTPFERVYIDNRIGALIIIITCVGIILDRANIEVGKYIFNSAVVVLQYTLLLIGAAVIYYFAKNRFNMNKTSAVIITIALILPPMGTLAFYIGLADLIVDFRKVDPNRLFKGRNKQ
jgi:uncharacterized protein YybS (DUF2232 family)